ncbi:MAG TPA: HAD family hydrolase [Roseiflexaceae bacterium]|nr:HAD family hydrolase [Roseiflexaceae bacterium]HMP41187.1 HAD family hydrolase [Roseiflexaceae bacterium]
MSRRASGEYVIAFDADDTLWHNEPLFADTQAQFRELLAPYHDADYISRMLYDVEMRNLRLFGYGIKGFTLSMIETAIELTEGRISGHEIGRIIESARAMMQAPTRLLDDAQNVVATLGARYRLMLITKGDLFDQEAKLARSGLAEYFRHVEIVSEKTPITYRRILEQHAIAPEHFLMVGNSPRSDILPVLAIGGSAVYIPYHMLWLHEQIDPPPPQAGLYELRRLAELPDLITRIWG